MVIYKWCKFCTWRQRHTQNLVSQKSICKLCILPVHYSKSKIHLRGPLQEKSNHCQFLEAFSRPEKECFCFNDCHKKEDMSSYEVFTINKPHLACCNFAIHMASYLSFKNHAFKISWTNFDHCRQQKLIDIIISQLTVKSCAGQNSLLKFKLRYRHYSWYSSFNSIYC